MDLKSGIAAVVTGGASGLGEATARRLAADGAKVAIFDMNAERGALVAKEIGGVFCQVDVTSDASVAAGFLAARARHGQERVLVNCAGIATGAKTASRPKDGGAPKPAPLDAFEKTVQINLIGTFRCIAQSAAGMMGEASLDDGERGVIVCTASVAAVDGQIGQAAYSASKAGVAGMTLPIARDLSTEGIRVVTILPGTFETPMMAAMSEPVRAGLAAGVPFPKRMGRPAEYASLVAEICRNVYLNGECIRLDGAIRMAPR
ncbi:MAG: SDR family NAD(P)-dependent oxidoreductase [Xanthobacteraceae bacterium]|nr:MAG: SDR family NAD(P)-dependent oxidoreductase [Xanthobacteraceae bacterium]